MVWYGGEPGRGEEKREEKSEWSKQRGQLLFRYMVAERLRLAECVGGTSG